MNIVYSSSDQYSELAGISILSLCKSNMEADTITIYMIDDGISPKNKDRLITITKSFGRDIVFLQCLDIESMLKIKIKVGKWHLSTFNRLMLGSMLPENIERVLYIDCDTIILHSLARVWEMDMDGNYVMGVDDCRSSGYRTNIGLNGDHIYINNGFIVVNLKAWRDDGVEQQYLDFIQRYKGDITYMDQGVLNGVLGVQDKVGLLPPSYNAQTVFYDFSYDQISLYRHPVWVYSREEIRNSIADPTVVHFTSCFISGTRPWHEKNNHPYRCKFIALRDISPWKDEPLWEDDRKTYKKVITKILNLLPRGFVLFVFSILHVKVYPWLRNRRNGAAC